VNRSTTKTRKLLDGFLGAAIAVLVALYVASVGPYWNISPDSATYVGWAKALVAGIPYERGPVQPPATSLIYTAILFVFPDGYTALNAATVLLILLSLAIVFALVKRSAGRTAALLVVLLSLASTRLYHESAQLLSEPAYMLFSMAALWFVDRPPDAARGVGNQPPSSRRDTVLAGLMMVVTVLTRLIGLALVLAVCIRELWCVVRRQRPANRVLLVFAAASLAAIVLWDLAGAKEPYAANWFRMFVLQDVWTSGSASLSPRGLVARAGEHLDQLLVAGRLLMNGWESRAWPGWALPTTISLVCLGGLAATLRRRVSVTAIYVLLYVAVTVAHALGGGGDAGRILVPVLPLLIFFTVEGARGVTTWVSRSVWTPVPSRALIALASVCIALFVFIGIRAIRPGVREAHRSPFGAYPIKRPSNYDVQRVALMIRDRAGPGDTFASWQRDMIEVLAERRGYALSSGRVTPADSLIAWLARERIRYLVIDHRSGAIADSLTSAVRLNPTSFQLLSSHQGASLYELTWSKD